MHPLNDLTNIKPELKNNTNEVNLKRKLPDNTHPGLETLAKQQKVSTADLHSNSLFLKSIELLSSGSKDREKNLLAIFQQIFLLKDEVTNSCSNPGLIETKYSAKPKYLFYTESNPVPIAILKEDATGTRGNKEAVVYELAALCSFEDFFVPSTLFQANIATNATDTVQVSGVLQPYTADQNIKTVSDEDIFNGKLEIPFSAILQAVIIQLQFGMDDAISENFFVNTEKGCILHFDNEHDLPISNYMKLEEEIEATPPFCSALLAHPDANRPLTNDEKLLLSAIIDHLIKLEVKVKDYIELRKKALEQIPGDNASDILTAWEQRTEWMCNALEELGNEEFSLVDFVLMAHPTYQMVKYYQIASVFIENYSSSSDSDEEMPIQQQPCEDLIRKTMGELTTTSNYLPELLDTIKEYDDSTESSESLKDFIEDSLSLNLVNYIDGLKNFLEK